jgi:hypothetical protein
VEIGRPRKLTATGTLKDLVMPNTELIPEEVRSKVQRWSDYIDYWAVDWHFQNDTFMQDWVAYRTRRERKLPSPPTRIPTTSPDVTGCWSKSWIFLATTPHRRLMRR